MAGEAPRDVLPGVAAGDMDTGMVFLTGIFTGMPVDMGIPLDFEAVTGRLCICTALPDGIGWRRADGFGVSC